LWLQKKEDNTFFFFPPLLLLLLDPGQGIRDPRSVTDKNPDLDPQHGSSGKFLLIRYSNLLVMFITGREGNQEVVQDEDKLSH
jgi:hypothetical protein